MNRSEILGTAKSHIVKDREATHGKPENSFGRLAGLWSALLGHEVNAGQVALMLSCLKIARAWGNPAHADNWIDLAGYAACGGEIATSTNTPNENLPIAAHIAKRDAERALDTDPQPMEWPVAPACAPPDGLGDVSATHVAEIAEGHSTARVCGGCKWWERNGEQRLGHKRCLNGRETSVWRSYLDACEHWKPSSDLASIAAREATSWQGQDGGVE